MSDVTPFVTRDSHRMSRRESQDPARTDPIRPCPALPQEHVGSPSSISSSYVSARAATEPSDTHQPHAIAPSWMRADR